MQEQRKQQKESKARVGDVLQPNYRIYIHSIYTPHT